MRPRLSGKARFCLLALALLPLIIISTLHCPDARAEGGVALSPKWGSVTDTGKNPVLNLAALTTAVPVPASDASREMLQFKSGSHILGFQPTKAYLVSLDHSLNVEFLGAKGVMPTSSGSASAGKAGSLGKVEYRELWPGVSLSYESTKAGIVESTYHLSPGADVSRIRLRYNVPVEKQGDGSLRLTFDRGYLSESPPVAWQDIRGERIPVEVSFRVTGGEIGFKVGDYNPQHPLTIDPTYAWHTFYGSGGYDEYVRSIAVDSVGNVYVAGISYMTWGSPLHAHSGSYDVFILKLNGNGAYQWHTFYGSGGYDWAYSIAVDGAGNVYVAGESLATWGSPLHAHSGGNDGFILKLDGSGAYQWHTFYGSGSTDSAQSIAVDSVGNVYAAGYSDATWGSPLHAHSGNYDVFILKLSGNGAYQWHTFYGSGGYDVATSVAVDSVGNVYVAGISDATWGSPLHAHSGSGDIFVLKLDGNGAYQWHTFHGSGDYDGANSIAVDSIGNVYVAGFSGATWGSPLHAHSGGYDGIILKLDGNGAYQWHTFYGSGDDDGAGSVAVDSAGNVYVAGHSDATWGSPLHAHSGGYDVSILKLAGNGAYQWHTFYGSGGYDWAYSIAVNSGGNVYVAGQSDATWGSPLHAHSGAGYDIVVLKLNDTGAGDFNFDGKRDILWRNATTGDNYVWFMNGTAFAGSALLFNVPSPWQIVGTGDFNADGKPDIIWRNPTSGENWVWFMNGTAFAGSALLFTIPSPWEIVGVGDFNADGKPDILWRNPTSGDNYVWFMNGTQFSGSALLFNVPSPWQIVGVGDFNSDGKPDIIWRNPTTGDNYVWFMNGTAFTGSALLFNVPSPWQIVGVGDFNADGKPDILWRNPTTGDNYVWFMNGTAFTGSALLFNVPAPWEIVGH